MHSCYFLSGSGLVRDISVKLEFAGHKRKDEGECDSFDENDVRSHASFFRESPLHEEKEVLGITAYFEGLAL